MERKILPSLLSADFSRLEEDLKKVEKAGITHLHLDVMDGHFVPNISFGPGVIGALRKRTDLFFDTHLMVEEPDFLFGAFAKAGCQMITVHWEAVKHLHRSIQAIHELGMQAGVSLNPATPPDVLRTILPELDLVLVMSVNPGFGGQSYIPSMTEKIRTLREMIDATGKDIVLEVDGGIKLSNLDEVVDAGADWMVAGSAIFGQADVTEAAKAFQKRVSA